VKNKFLNKEKQKREMSNLTDKVVVITGASSGIGESTAKLLAQQGARVVLGARRSTRIDAVVQEISAAGGKSIGFATDVTKRAEVEALIQRAVDGFGRVDVLLNNAGIMPIAPIEALKVEEWDRQIEVPRIPCASPFRMSRAMSGDRVSDSQVRDFWASLQTTVHAILTLAERE
jgi:NAD(P)-dependent dehydrogenase (short-subunit alcohol dehydrogenase family)